MWIADVNEPHTLRTSKCMVARIEYWCQQSERSAHGCFSCVLRMNGTTTTLRKRNNGAKNYDGAWLKQRQTANVEKAKKLQPLVTYERIEKNNFDQPSSWSHLPQRTTLMWTIQAKLLPQSLASINNPRFVLFECLIQMNFKHIWMLRLFSFNMPNAHPIKSHALSLLAINERNSILFAVRSVPAMASKNSRQNFPMVNNLFQS